MTKKPLWGGRFQKTPAEEAAAFTRSISFDRRLLPYDIRATAAHARALKRAGLLSEVELAQLEETLREAEALESAGSFPVNGADEDIHSALERFLTDRLGDAGAKIHAGRSRNDLVVTDLRLWVKDVITEIIGELNSLISTIAARASENRETLAPGYTHLQRGQPIVLAHLLLAHAFALKRDLQRLSNAKDRADVSALGAGALAGSMLPLDAVTTAEDLGFAGVFDNAADAVSDRDFALEFLSAGAILGVHLSRLAEEIVLWTSEEFGFASLDDAYATGSSIMPQKKNPDVAELARAKSARLTAHLMHLLGVMKGLPLAYNRDLQEDKEPVFDAADTLLLMLPALNGVMATITFDVEALEEAAGAGHTGATDLAEWLVGHGVPFRDAHEAVGELVGRLQREGRDLRSVTTEELKAAHERFGEDALSLLDPRASVAARNTWGGTSPHRVREQMERLGRLSDGFS